MIRKNGQPQPLLGEAASHYGGGARWRCFYPHQALHSTLLLTEPEKLQVRLLLTAVGIVGTEELLIVEDANSGRRLLMDSGAQRNVLPASSADTLVGGHGPQLETANSTLIPTFCTRHVTVCFNGCSLAGTL